MDGCRGGVSPFVETAMGRGHVPETVFECAPLKTFVAAQKRRRGSIYDTKASYLMTFVHEYAHQYLRLRDWHVPVVHAMTRAVKKLNTQTSTYRILDEGYAILSELKASRRLFPEHFERLKNDFGRPGSQQPHDLGTALALSFLDSSADQGQPSSERPADWAGLRRPTGSF